MFHESNAGKGASLRTWFRQATREYAIVQDADLEYDPKDYARLLEAALVRGNKCSSRPWPS